LKLGTITVRGKSEMDKNIPMERVNGVLNLAAKGGLNLKGTI
jgi:hypothetical protein